MHNMFPGLFWKQTRLPNREVESTSHPIKLFQDNRVLGNPKPTYFFCPVWWDLSHFWALPARDASPTVFCSRLRGQTVLDCIGRADSCSTTAFPFHSHFPGAESLLGLYLLLTIWVLSLSSLHTKFVLDRLQRISKKALNCKRKFCTYI